MRLNSTHIAIIFKGRMRPSCVRLTQQLTADHVSRLKSPGITGVVDTAHFDAMAVDRW
jgi:hypothetical protein